MKYIILHSVKTFFIVLALVSLITMAYVFHKYSVEIINWVNHIGWLAPFLFIIIYTLATIIFLPTMVLTFAGGAIFGPFWHNP